MFTFSTFTAQWNSLKGRMNERTRREIGREALERVQARYATGRADSALCFRDLCERLEVACGA